MPLDQNDLDQIAGMIGNAVSTSVTTAQFGGPVVAVAPSDLVYLSGGRYISERTGKMYEKHQGRLLDLGKAPG